MKMALQSKLPARAVQFVRQAPLYVLPFFAAHLARRAEQPADEIATLAAVAVDALAATDSLPPTPPRMS